MTIVRQPYRDTLKRGDSGKVDCMHDKPLFSVSDNAQGSVNMTVVKVRVQVVTYPSHTIDALNTAVP